MQAILFDIDGTLISTGGAGTAALLKAMTTAFHVADPRPVPVTGRTDRAIVRDLLQGHGIEDTPPHWERLRSAYLSHLPEVLAEFQGRILPGIQSLLTSLCQNENLQLGLLTGNTQEGARLKLTHFGLYQHFAFGGYGDRHICRNDVARDAYAQVSSRLAGRADPRQVWVIGDTPLDVACARAIGANCVAVATGTHRMEELAACQPDLLVPDLAAPDLIQRLTCA